MIKKILFLLLLLSLTNSFAAPKPKLNQSVAISGPSTLLYNTSTNISASAATKVTFRVNDLAVCSINGTNSPKVKNKLYTISLYGRNSGTCIVYATAVASSKYNSAESQISIAIDGGIAQLNVDSSPIGIFSSRNLHPTSTNSSSEVIATLQAYGDGQLSECDGGVSSYCYEFKLQESDIGYLCRLEYISYQSYELSTGFGAGNNEDVCKIKLTQGAGGNYQSAVEQIFNIKVVPDVVYLGTIYVTNSDCDSVSKGSMGETYYYPANSTKITSNKDRTGFTILGDAYGNSSNWHLRVTDSVQNFTSSFQRVDHVSVGSWGSGEINYDNISGNENYNSAFNPTEIRIISSSPDIVSLDYNVDSIALVGEIKNPYNETGASQCTLGFKYTGFLKN